MHPGRDRFDGRGVQPLLTSRHPTGAVLPLRDQSARGRDDPGVRDVVAGGTCPGDRVRDVFGDHGAQVREPLQGGEVGWVGQEQGRGDREFSSGHHSSHSAAAAGSAAVGTGSVAPASRGRWRGVSPDSPAAWRMCSAAEAKKESATLSDQPRAGGVPPAATVDTTAAVSARSGWRHSASWPGGVASWPGVTVRDWRPGWSRTSCTSADGPPMQRQSSSHSVATSQDRSRGNSSSGRALCHGVASRFRRADSARPGPPASRT